MSRAAGTGCAKASQSRGLALDRPGNPKNPKNPLPITTDDALLGCDRPSTGRCRTPGLHQCVFTSIAGGPLGEKSAFELPILRRPPVAHRVWGGNVAETSTLASAIAEVTRMVDDNFPAQRIILVADRELLSADNLAMLDAPKVAGKPLEYIVVVPGRRNAEFVQVLADAQALCVAHSAEVFGEVPWSSAQAKEPSGQAAGVGTRCAACGRAVAAAPFAHERVARALWSMRGNAWPGLMRKMPGRPPGAASCRTLAPRRGCTTRASRPV